MIHLNFAKFILPALFAICSLHAEGMRYLQISTTPHEVDIYLQDRDVDFSSTPDFESSSFIPIPDGENSIMATLFRNGYKDTTLSITLSSRDTSYLRVTLTPTYDEATLSRQQSILNHRLRKKIGHIFIASSTLPLLASGIFAIATQYNISRAETKKDFIEDSRIRSGDYYQSNLDLYTDYRQNAKTLKNWTLGTLIAGGIFVTAGLVLSF